MLATTTTKWADDDDDEVRRDDDEEFFTAATRGRELSPSSRSSTDRPQRRPQSAAQKLRLGAQFHRENVSTMPEMTNNAAVITSSLDQLPDEASRAPALLLRLVMAELGCSWASFHEEVAGALRLVASTSAAPTGRHGLFDLLGTGAELWRMHA